MTKAIIFDRDGTLIYDIPYIHEKEKVKVLPAVKETILELFEKNIKIFLHTNQSGIGRGYFDIEKVRECNYEMIMQLGFDPFTSICIAPDNPENFSSYNDTYRKPSPRFVEEIKSKFNFTGEEIFYIGNSECDLETAHLSGTKGIGLNICTKKLNDSNSHGYPLVNNFDDIKSIILT